MRLGPEQFPDLHARVERLSLTFGMRAVPEAYLMQAGGALNAFATRFLRSNMIVLYSDLLEACGDNAGARDMIIAHELGHLAAGHLRYRWLVLPAAIIPFLGTALSRAREYTCDRYGAVGAGDRDAALLGLTVLAAGGKLATQVNRAAFVRQRDYLETGWMTIGEWLSTHPPLCKRISALDDTSQVAVPERRWGVARAIGILGATAGVSLGLVVVAARFLGPLFRQAANQTGVRPASGVMSAADNRRSATALQDLTALARIVDGELRAGRRLPENDERLYELWQTQIGGDAPIDPFDGSRYGYVVAGRDYRLWSSGPDGESGTDDDIVVQSGMSSRR